jgi:hypothetical protein
VTGDKIALSLSVSEDAHYLLWQGCPTGRIITK